MSKKVIMRRENNKNVPYLTRYYIVPNNEYLNVYLHNIHRSDMDNELHDHPWDSVSILLKGFYLEEVPLDYDKWINQGNRDTVIHIRDTWKPVFRSATTIHKIKLRDQAGNISGSSTEGRAEGIWTLFITGPVVRQWSFWCKKGPRVNTDYLSADGLSVGRGCN
jgi:hypothetical protein